MMLRAGKGLDHTVEGREREKRGYNMWLRGLKPRFKM
jgi:hypothetical protein